MTRQAIYMRDKRHNNLAFREKDRIKKRIWWKKRQRAIKLETFYHYCEGVPHCQCPGCEEKHIEFLTIDHINGGGKQHRKEIGIQGGKEFCVWLKRNEYPSGFRVLCFNCNSAIGAYGYCPHKKESNNATI